MRQYGVCNEKRGDPGPKDRRQRHHAERLREWRIGQPGTDGHDDQCRERQMERGMATDKGYFPGPDDMDYERLGEERLHEPTGLKELLQHFLALCPRRGIDEGAAMEKEPHEGKRGIIKDGTYGPYEDHESFDVADVPLEGPGGQLIVYPVHGNSGLRKIIE